jgi:putative protease
MEKRLHKTFAERENELKFPVKMRLFANFGEPLSLEIQDADGHKVVARSEKNLERAKTPRDNSERIQKELSALTGTAYFAREMRLDIPSDAFVIDKEVRNLRKAAVEALDNARFDSHPSEASAERGKALIANARSTYQDKNIQESDTAKPEQITVLVRSPKQLEKLQGLDIDRVILDLDWGVDYKKPMERVRELGFQVGVATIRVLKEGETKNLKKLADLKPDFILVRNPGALVYLQDSGIPLEGDYSLNVSNILSAEWFLSQGLRSLHPSLDLNALGTEKLLENFGGAHFEVSVFEHLPAFYMEHCLYAANLTDAERFPYCKQICSKHHIDILDHKGALHSLVPDAECRNTLYLERPQSALNLVPTFKKLGVHKFRLEMLEESAAEVADKTRLYAQAIRGKLSLATAAKLIGAEEKYGVSQGQLFHTEVWKDRKKA